MLKGVTKKLKISLIVIYLVKEAVYNIKKKSCTVTLILLTLIQTDTNLNLRYGP